MNVQNKRVLVVGLARSGIASAHLLFEEGAAVTIYDAKSPDQLASTLDEFAGMNIEYALGVDPIPLLDGKDLMVLSPGVPPSLPFIQEAYKRNIEVIGEIELGYRFAKAPIMAISGTNGKTTTTALTGEIFKADGAHTLVLGNIGIPIVKQARESLPTDIIVAEVAALQLETVVDFRPRSCALLNITEDHLDRFGTMEAYIESKAKMFDKQLPQDFATLNLDDPGAMALEHRIRCRKLLFSRKQQVDEGACLVGNDIVFRLDGHEQRICCADEVAIPGTHNLENALAAICVALPVGVHAQAAAQALRTFEGVEHRIEFVAQIRGVRYINDSKATNPDSAIKGIQAMTTPTVLLLGGSNKNSNYCPVFEAFDGNIKAVIALGETAPQIMRDAQITGYKNIHMCAGSFEDAVLMAAKIAVPGDTVLLSPACASYDMFDNFEHRGRVFKQIVASL